MSAKPRSKLCIGPVAALGQDDLLLQLKPGDQNAGVGGMILVALIARRLYHYRVCLVPKMAMYISTVSGLVNIRLQISQISQADQS